MPYNRIPFDRMKIDFPVLFPICGILHLNIVAFCINIVPREDPGGGGLSRECVFRIPRVS